MKNGRMQIWRIIFTYLIAFYHLNNAYGVYHSWYLGVEFFFVLSGFLLAKKYEILAETGDIINYSAWDYTRRRYFKFIPHTAYAFLVAWAIAGIYEKLSVKEFFVNGICHLPELLLIDSIGLNLDTSFFYNNVTWYLSVLLISGYFIWFCMTKNKKLYLHFIVPLVLLIIFPFFLENTVRLRSIERLNT